MKIIDWETKQETCLSALGEKIKAVVEKLSFRQSCLVDTAEEILIENYKADGVGAYAIANEEILTAKYFSSDVKDFQFGLIVMPMPNTHNIICTKKGGTPDELNELLHLLGEELTNKPFITVDCGIYKDGNLIFDVLIDNGFIPNNDDIIYCYLKIQDEIKNGKLTPERQASVKQDLDFDFTDDSFSKNFDYEKSEYTICWDDIKNKPNVLQWLTPHFWSLSKRLINYE